MKLTKPCDLRILLFAIVLILVFVIVVSIDFMRL